MQQTAFAMISDVTPIMSGHVHSTVYIKQITST